MFKILKNNLALTLTILSLALSPMTPVFGAGSTFTSSLTTYGVASVPPSVPANLVAVPVSDTQIDLTWDASVGGGIYLVSGYRIFRNAAFLATTTSLSYADMGLIASTTYSYTVEAFDTVMSLSGQSGAVATSTLQTPVVPPAATTSVPAYISSVGSSSGTNLIIENPIVKSGIDQVDVAFYTTLPAQTRVMWGQTPDFEAGSLQGLMYGYSHNMVLNNLQSGTEYFLRLQAIDNRGVTAVRDLTFTTLSAETPGALPNPSAFTAVADKNGINLNWQNPRDARFAGVRIVRSDSFFPRDQNDGMPIYEGGAPSFKDITAIPGQTYYYAIFAKGNNGQFSSGALAQARIALTGEVMKIPTSNDPFVNIPESKNVDQRISALSLNDFDFVQNGKVVSQNTFGHITIDGSKNLTIRLPYSKVPEVLKTIAITLSDPNDHTKVFPFLLRVNADKSAYEATVGALGKSGDYALSVVVLDYQNQGLKRLNGDLLALVAASVPTGNVRKSDLMGMLFLLMIVVALVSIVMMRRRVTAEIIREKAVISK